MRDFAKKRGQVTLFIVLGLVALITIFILFYIQSLANDLSGETTRLLDDQQNLQAPENYLDLCVEQEVKNTLQNAQSLFDDAGSYLYQNNVYGFVYTQTGGVNPVVFTQVANLIDEKLPDKIDSCFDTTIYENQGIQVERGQVKTKTTVNFDTISVVLDFPLVISGSEVSYDLSSKRVVVDLSYGRVIEALNRIVSDEVKTGWFDQVAYMHQQKNVYLEKPLIVIEKQKPYPHTLYNVTLQGLDESYSILVALEGIETTLLRNSQVNFDFSKRIENTCCEFDGLCSQGVSQDICMLKGGFFKEDCGCEVEEIIPAAEYDTCEGIESGTSWCEYHPGVGGRFYRNSCTDGVVSVESCRDFREEVCVESNDVALCRPNTAQSCFTCTDENCCNKYDCSYVAEGVCVPEAPLGFEFWESTQNYCQNIYTKISSQSDITSFTSREREFLCSLLSDCGNTFNYYGDFSVETIDGEKLKDVLTDTGILNRETVSSPISKFELPESNITTSKQIAQTVSHLQEFLDITKEEFLDPQEDISFANTISQICQPFYPSQNTCEVCGTQGRPCSEYACKSLGTQCQYILADGDYQCVSQVPSADNFVISSVTVNENPVTNTQLGNISGFKLQSEHSINNALTISFQTNQEALCKPSYLPGIDFGEISANALTNGVYQKNHSLTIRFINNLPVFGSLQDYFSAKDFTALVSEIIDFSFQIENLQRKYPFIDRYQLPFAKALTQFVRVTTDLGYDQEIKTLLNNAQSGTYALFLACVDTEGAKLSEQSFVQFSLTQSCTEEIDFTIKADADPFIDTHLSVITPVFSECRYDVIQRPFDNMTYEFDCADSLYDVSDEGYTCRANVKSLIGNQTSLQLFTQCRENMGTPLKKEITLTLVETLNSSEADDAFARSNGTFIDERDIVVDMKSDEVVESTIQKNESTPVIFTFSHPASCDSEELAIGCTADECQITSPQIKNISSSQITVSCETLPESLLCHDTFALARLSPLKAIELQKVSQYVIDNVQASPTKFSFVAYSDVLRDISCSYSIEDGSSILILDSIQRDPNVEFTHVFEEEQSGLLKISCVDEFGILADRSVLI